MCYLDLDPFLFYYIRALDRECSLNAWNGKFLCERQLLFLQFFAVHVVSYYFSKLSFAFSSSALQFHMTQLSEGKN